MGARWLTLLTWFSFLCGVAGQTASNDASPVLENEAARAWSFTLSVDGNIVPDGPDYVQPTLSADRDWLHLEARYNYEALKTGSLWAGWNFSGGKSLEWAFTPMLGGVFGDVRGVAPGYEGSLRWWKLELYSEGEYVFDLNDSSESYFFNWSQLTLAPVDWFYFGLVAQRTRVYETDREVQRGFLVGVSYRMMDLTTYVLNPDAGDPTVIVELDVSF